ncbi:MAG: ExbD/TolR family protein, partial [Pseudobdellovibrionaceae bacterium]
MAQIEESGKGGRKKNIELNLVPFIDLMSVLITFLLLTAVWTQVSMIQIGSSIYGKKSDDQTPLPPQDADIVLRLDIVEAGYKLTLGKQSMPLPKIAGKLDDDGLRAQLQRAKQMYPNKSDAVVFVQDDIPYEHLIIGMDTLINSGFPQVSIATG